MPFNDEERELLKRAGELSRRADERATVENTMFLTPAQQYLLSEEAAREKWDNMYMFGGSGDCERKMAFFLPFYVEKEDFDGEGCICAIEAETKFETPSHRDYLGSLMGLGIRRECVGDIRIFGEKGYFFCAASVSEYILRELTRIGRAGVSLKLCEMCDVPGQEKSVKKIEFTVKSMRLDAVLSGMFGISRASAAKAISEGAVTYNYRECLSQNVRIEEGDIIALRGRGKGTVVRMGGESKKGRIFVETEIYK